VDDKRLSAFMARSLKHWVVAFMACPKATYYLIKTMAFEDEKKGFVFHGQPIKQSVLAFDVPTE